MSCPRRPCFVVPAASPCTWQHPTGSLTCDSSRPKADTRSSTARTLTSPRTREPPGAPKQVTPVIICVAAWCCFPQSMIYLDNLMFSDWTTREMGSGPACCVKAFSPECFVSIKLVCGFFVTRWFRRAACQQTYHVFMTWIYALHACMQAVLCAGPDCHRLQSLHATGPIRFGSASQKLRRCLGLSR